MSPKSRSICDVSLYYYRPPLMPQRSVAISTTYYLLTCRMESFRGLGQDAAQRSSMLEMDTTYLKREVGRLSNSTI